MQYEKLVIFVLGAITNQTLVRIPFSEVRWEEVEEVIAQVLQTMNIGQFKNSDQHFLALALMAAGYMKQSDEDEWFLSDVAVALERFRKTSSLNPRRLAEVPGDE